MKRVLPHFSGSLGQFPTLTYFAKNGIIYFYYCPILVLAIFNITYSKPPISSNVLIFLGLVFTISAIFYPLGKNSFLVIFFFFFFKVVVEMWDWGQAMVCSLWLISFGGFWRSFYFFYCHWLWILKSSFPNHFLSYFYTSFLIVHSLIHII